MTATRSATLVSLDLARALRDGGVKWTPAAGDRFLVADRDMDSDVFTLADMTIELHRFGADEVIGFNGVTEWALDSIELGQALWLPSEAQLRELLAGTFRALTATESGYRVDVAINGRAATFDAAIAADAYGKALLHLVTGS